MLVLCIFPLQSLKSKCAVRLIFAFCPHVPVLGAFPVSKRGERGLQVSARQQKEGM